MQMGMMMDGNMPMVPGGPGGLGMGMGGPGAMAGAAG